MTAFQFRLKRTTDPDELHIIFRLDQKIFVAAEYGAMVNKSEMDHTVWWLLYKGKHPVGYCGVYICGDHAFHQRSGIVKKCRGNGLQRRMIKTREEFARKQGCLDISTYASVENPASINNLIKCGYRAYDPQWKWGRIPAIYLTKKL